MVVNKLQSRKISLLFENQKEGLWYLLLVFTLNYTVIINIRIIRKTEYVVLDFLEGKGKSLKY